jgi:hypothetical protein
MKIIEDLYLGKLNVEFLDGRKREQEEEKERRETERNEKYEAFLEGLTEKKKEEFREVEDLLWAQACEEVDDAYLRGFKTGARVMIEIYQDK